MILTLMMMMMFCNFQVLMFEAPNDKPWFDYWSNGDYCCTNEVVVAGG